MWVCGYCETENTEASSFCRACGRSRLEAKRNKGSKAKKSPLRTLFWIGVIIVALLALGLIFYIRGDLFPRPGDAPAGEVSLSHSHLTLPIGEEEKLKLTDEDGEDVDADWRSSDPEVASVSRSGRVRALKVGTAKITAETEDGASERCTVEVLFRDVTDPDAYYYKPVYWAVEKGITKGSSETEFGMGEACTREQAITFLWRMAGKPEPKTVSCPYRDLKTDAYYYEAVHWAGENGIAKANSDNEFGIGEACTREQAMTFLWRMAGKPEPSVTSKPFSDVTEDAYYYKAVLWAAENGITKGSSDGSFGVGQVCLREQTITFLYRYAERFM